jgi:hypothetical protein
MDSGVPSGKNNSHVEAINLCLEREAAYQSIGRFTNLDCSFSSPARRSPYRRTE